ncbi:uncharacterized protein [Chanodichthys erythropterus]|uniref:uncharacterized protein n=1 Tax=Chanodichthys erythropterus TaxID=933992 RepID=UPI00351EC229
MKKMFHTFIFCCCCLVGVFADELKSVSVMEGDSVTLQTDLTEIQTDDVIEWKFGNTRIAKINRELDEISTYDDVLDERFRDRLKLDHQTGSLTITNTRNTDSGLYEVTISSSSRTTTHRFTVTVTGVFADELKSVMEGDSVTLQTDTEIQTDDEIMWTFGTNRNLLAETDGVTSKIPDHLDERFRDRLKLDIKTGSLTITNITTEHAGDYEVEISLSSSETKHRFTVTVYGVFADELKSVSVMEGDSVTLQTNVTELQKGDRIKWKFGTNGSLIAKIFALTIDIPVNLTERFRDRLKLDNKTGSLTITNITTEHAGEYEAEISISKSSSYRHRFNVTVYAQDLVNTIPEKLYDLTVNQINNVLISLQTH